MRGNRSRGLDVAASESVKDLKLLETERGGVVAKGTTGVVCCWLLRYPQKEGLAAEWQDPGKRAFSHLR